MKLIRKAAALLASAALAFSAFSVPLGAYALTPEQAAELGEALNDGTFTYELVDGSYTITKCDVTASVSKVPELRNGYAITAIADGAFLGCTNIASLTIPESVKSIGVQAFAGCTSLSKVHLPSRLTEIPEACFMTCISLETVELSDNVTMIGENAFYGCTNLKEFKIPDKLELIGDLAFGDCASISSFDTEGSEHYLFRDGILYSRDLATIYRASTELSGDLYINENVTKIANGAFSMCAKLDNVFLPGSVHQLTDDVFGYCTNLRSVHFSEGLTDIGYLAFQFCLNLDSVDFPTTLRNIDDGAFYNCTALERIILPDQLDKIGVGSFLNCTALKNVLLPQGISSIGEHAFGFTDSTDGTFNKAEGFELSVFNGSEGAAYAKRSGISYKNVNNSLKKVLFITIALALVAAAGVFAAVLMSRGRKSASSAVKEADKLAAEEEEEKNYQKILD